MEQVLRFLTWFFGGSRASTNPAERSFVGYKNLSSASYSAGVITFTTVLTHYYEVDQTVIVAGATPSEYNITGFVTSTPSPTTFTVAVDSDPGAYSSGGYSVVEPKMVIQSSSAQGIALVCMSHEDSTVLGLDPDLPVFVVCDSDGNFRNKGWLVAADGHTVQCYAGGNLKEFSNGFVSNFSGDMVFGWTSSATSNPSIGSNVTLALRRSGTGILKIDDNAGGNGCLELPLSSAAPSAPTSGFRIYCVDVSGTITLRAIDSSGNVRDLH